MTEGFDNANSKNNDLCFDRPCVERAGRGRGRFRLAEFQAAANPSRVQQLQSQVTQARADVEFWELRLENYEPLRFTDATQSAIKYAENALDASRRREADSNRKLALVRRHRVALGLLRAQMLRQGTARSQLDR